MSKVLKNTTINSISISDTGVTLSASPATYTIPPQDYLLWAASSNIVTHIGNGNIIVNDGSTDLSISDGIDLIKDIFPKKMGVLSGNNLTPIGHVGDRLKVDAEISLIPEVEIKNDTGNPIPISGSVNATLRSSDIQKNTEFSITTKVETDISGMTFTVSAGKTFYITQFAAASDSPSPVSMYIRVYNGPTLINTIKLNLASNGAWGGHSWPQGVKFGLAGYTIKATINPQAAKGAGWVMFAGFEV